MIEGEEVDGDVRKTVKTISRRISDTNNDHFTKAGSGHTDAFNSIPFLKTMHRDPLVACNINIGDESGVREGFAPRVPTAEAGA